MNQLFLSRVHSFLSFLGSPSQYPNLKGSEFSGFLQGKQPPGLVEKMCKIGFGEMVLSCFRRWSGGNSVYFFLDALDLYADTVVHMHTNIYIYIHTILYMYVFMSILEVPTYVACSS